ncbi:DUF4037 domain-containing protein [Rathayibacter sp. KR2-224]|uniref:DUF4037 domain-containing protein n=1 Tax=Rathayibacter sp. KR2-224 TaxID=3400913 RepID=UPI003C0315F5
MPPSEPSGIRLSHAYYDEVVQPLLAERFPGMPYAAGRLGAGSDVLELDDDMSRDHDWGLRLSLFVPDDVVDAVDGLLERMLPATFCEHPTRFAFTGETEARHRIEVTTLERFLDARLGFDPRHGVSVDDWLSLTGQAALEVTAGPLFADATGELGRARDALRWYPQDLWRYVIACDWARLAQELPLAGRAGDRGDERGSRVIASRLSQIAMHLAFMLERRWPPYSKWFGTLFGRLGSASELGPAIDRALEADTWGARQAALAEALAVLLRVQNRLGLTSVEPATVQFWDRPYLHPNPAIVTRLLDGITDPEVSALPLGRGTIEQRTDNVDVLVNPSMRRTAAR